MKRTNLIKFSPSQQCTPLLLINQNSPEDPPSLSFGIRDITFNRNELTRSLWETRNRKNYQQIIDLCEEAMIKMNSLAPREEKKTQRRMPKELRGLSDMAKRHILKDLEILKYYIIYKQKDYNKIMKCLKAGYDRVKRVIEGYLKTGKLPLSYSRSRYKTPENVIEFMQNYFYNRDNVFKKISNLQKEIYDHPDFGHHK